jgi:hypothetical protein
MPFRSSRLLIQSQICAWDVYSDVAYILYRRCFAGSLEVVEATNLLRLVGHNTTGRLRDGFYQL